MKQLITTAVFPVAGMGTRFLPVTKAGPKEMLPIVDKPLIQYVVEEAIAVGIKKLVFVTSSGKRAIEDYFDCNFELESMLAQKGKIEILNTVRNIIPADVKIVYVRQPRPKGLGDAVLCAKPVVGNEPFAVLLADDIMEHAHETCLTDMIKRFHETQCSVLAVENISRKDTDKYGIVSMADHPQFPLQISSITEKPLPEKAPSTLAVTGRYILTPRIFDMLEQIDIGVGGELQLTDGLAKLLHYEAITVCTLQGRRYDCGSRLGFLQATLDFALKRSEFREPLLDYIKKISESASQKHACSVAE
ncbi:MAG: UTP--glucose-1-phosphate uridylyltransferase [Gammaproteobacteria bacterium RIFCSPHIGHO2_12_FULL_38_11]|nr:MAG: UTP--glucose-1-phosphate uridylyltransferase [Gammaproteobacteria bacterium RIFCSPHIGHO2_12_FULL_38_11]